MPKSTLDTTEPGLFAIFKGESGVGKSVAALSFPGIYVMDFDVKMPAIANKHFPGKDIAYDTFTDIFKVSEQLEAFKGNCPYETIIADSFTNLANLVIHSAGKIKGESVPQLLAKVTPRTNTIEMMGIDYYSAEDRFCTYFIEQLKTLWMQEGNPKHVIVLAHVVTVDSAPDLKTKVVTRTRSIVSKGKKVAAWLPSGFDNVFTFFIQQPDLGDISPKAHYIAKTQAFGEDSAKCAFSFPETVDFTEQTFYDQVKKYTSWERKESK